MKNCPATNPLSALLDPGLTLDRGLSVAAVSSVLGCDPSTVRKLCRRGELKGVRVGRAVRIWQSSLEQYASRNAIGAVEARVLPPVRVIQKQTNARHAAARERLTAMGF